jgi:hypothetical protein
MQHTKYIDSVRFSTVEDQVVRKAAHLPNADSAQVKALKVAETANLGIVSQFTASLFYGVQESNGSIDAVLQ